MAIQSNRYPSLLYPTPAPWLQPLTEESSRLAYDGVGERLEAGNAAFSHVSILYDHSSRRPCRDHIARQQGHDARVERDEPPRREGHVRDRVGTMDLAVEYRSDLQSVYVLYLFGSYEFGAEGEEGIEALRTRQVARVPAQNILCGHIQHGGEPRDDGVSVLLGYILCLTSDNNSEFALGGHPFRLGRQHDLVVRADDGRVWPHEARRLVGRSSLGEIAGVLDVVQADPPDLARAPVKRRA